MSLILEALRKSEAERRRAQVPDLLAEPQSAAMPVAATPPRWPWLVLGAAVLLGALWLARAWWATPASPVALPMAGARNAAAERTTPIRTTKPGSTSVPTARPLVLAPPAAAVPTRATPASAANMSSTADTMASAHAAREATTPSPSAETAAAAAPPVPAPAAPAPVAAPVPADNLLRLSDLASEERSQLPPLKLSMHLWNDAPAQRFVIIDGNRVGIGGRIGAVEVADIVSDGVVLDWNGRLLKLPLR
jgi:general secretion pathway protein B